MNAVVCLSVCLSHIDAASWLPALIQTVNPPPPLPMKASTQSKWRLGNLPKHEWLLRGFYVSLAPTHSTLSRTTTQTTCTSFNERRNASAVYAVVMCPSVCLSHATTVSKRLHRSSWVFAHSFSTDPTLCFRDIRVEYLQNSGYFPSLSNFVPNSIGT